MKTTKNKAASALRSGAVLVKKGFLAAMLCSTAGIVNAQTWNCGASPSENSPTNSVQATLSGGVLTIRKVGSSGEMKASFNNSGYFNIPWSTYMSSITSVIIEEGVTSISMYAFVDANNLTSVSIPSSIITIGINAFFNCPNLTSITIPEGVVNIGDLPIPITAITLPTTIASCGRLGEGVDGSVQATLQWTSAADIPDAYLFENMKPSGIIIPAGTYDLYVAKGWNKVGNILRQMDLDILIADTLRLYNQAAQLQQENAALQAQVTPLANRVAALRADSASLKAQLTAAQGEVSSLQAQVNTANQTISTHNATISQLNTDLAACRSSKGTAVTSEVVSLLNIYPNPVQNGELFIDDVALLEGEKVEIYAINGGLAAVKEITGMPATISIGNLAAGTYIVKVKDRAAKVVKR